MTLHHVFTICVSPSILYDHVSVWWTENDTGSSPSDYWTVITTTGWKCDRSYVARRAGHDPWRRPFETELFEREWVLRIHDGSNASKRAGDPPLPSA